MNEEMNEEMTTIEKLSLKYSEVFGSSPKYGFWSWLEAVGVNPNEEELIELLNGTDYWDEIEEWQREKPERK